MKVIHRFYLLLERDRKKKVWSFIFNMILLISIIVFLAWSINWIILLLIQPVLSIFASFIDVPVARKNGKLLYFSPLLLASAVRNNILQLHGGTLFDYYYTLSIEKSEARNRKIILYSYIEGLLNLLKHFSQHQDDIVIQANAYFINPSTAARIGFKTVPTQFITKIIMLLNYLPITISYSIAMGKLSFPNILSLNSYECQLGELRKNQSKLEAMFERIKN